jgi:hypothetical protein
MTCSCREFSMPVFDLCGELLQNFSPSASISYQLNGLYLHRMGWQAHARTERSQANGSSTTSSIGRALRAWTDGTIFFDVRK